MEQFSVGDLVRPKSGGPLMTIRSIEGDRAVCVYCEPRPKGWNKTDYVDLAAMTKLTLKENS